MRDRQKPSAQGLLSRAEWWTTHPDECQNDGLCDRVPRPAKGLTLGVHVAVQDLVDAIDCAQRRTGQAEQNEASLLPPGQSFRLVVVLGGRAVVEDVVPDEEAREARVDQVHESRGEEDDGEEDWQDDVEQEGHERVQHPELREDMTRKVQQSKDEGQRSCR